MKQWKLKRTHQCQKCPWRTATNPFDIPDGYTEERHRALKQTIAEDPMASLAAYLEGRSLAIMACHEMHETHCIGWLVNQIGPGNNIQLRLHMAGCTNRKTIRLRGPQHERFEDTLPCP